MSEEQTERNPAVDTAAGVIFSISWMQPILSLGYELLGGCVPMAGTVEEYTILKRAGVPCYNCWKIGHITPELGEVCWQTPRKYVKRAQAILKRYANG